ncbi:MAG TPA: PIG-L deacetylase family protein [Nocardioides sp.]|nr:PIG-L deacetylase family protein [Nocardioides sp.]
MLLELSSLLAVFAHPDDESLAAGGVLARHAAAGARTAVVTATWAPTTRRAAELADALRVLGAGEPTMLGYADAKVPESAPGRRRWCDAPLDEAVLRLVIHIREFRPEALVTFDARGGLTGHPDHVHAHRVTVLAAEVAGRDVCPDAGQPWTPSAVYLATHPRSSLQRIEEILGARGARNTTPDEEVTDRVDVSPWLDQKVAAILAHRSEVDRGALPGLVARLSPMARAELLATEWFIRRPVARAEGDEGGSTWEPGADPARGLPRRPGAGTWRGRASADGSGVAP